MICPKTTCPNLATEKCPSPDAVVPNFTELIICDELVIPAQKPDIEYISNILLDVCLSTVETIDVNLGDGVDRKKFIFKGNLGIGTEYSADVPEQEVHFAHYSLPFNGYIGERPCTPDGNKGLLPGDFNLEDYNIHYCIEYINYEKIDSRKFNIVAVMLIWLELKS